MVAYRHDETARLAQDMPRKAITVTQDETFTGGLCLVSMDPESNFIILHTPSNLEAIRKPCRPVTAISRNILAVVKHRVIARRKPIKHKMNIADLNHSST